MKLVQIVKRIEDAGLEPVLSVQKFGLHLTGWTCVNRVESRPLVGIALSADSCEPIGPWENDARIIDDLAKAANHPDAIARRKWLANYEKDLADEAARSRNAA
jgi:hypothetical protein